MQNVAKNSQNVKRAYIILIYVVTEGEIKNSMEVVKGYGQNQCSYRR